MLFSALLLTGCAQIEPVTVEPEGLVPGIFSLGPAGDGFVEETLLDGRCKNGDLPEASAGESGLCAGGRAYESLDSTWANPDVVGVYVRLPWESIHKAPGTKKTSFNFTILDHELNQAVKHQKRVMLSFSAGKGDLPDWLFTEGGVEPLQFQDGGSKLEAGQCGSRMTLGDPTDENYQDHYFDLIRGVGEHIQAKEEWSDAVAYFKISGANLYTHEFRLPNSCDPACAVCNTEVWAKAGYTPEGIYDFVLNQMGVIQEVFPGKPMVYQLIQDGLPWVNDQGDYLMADGTSSGRPVTRSVEQVEEIIKRGSEAYGPLFVVAHNGLSSSGKPNRWVIQAGKQGQPTGFQTGNTHELTSIIELQSALENLWDNTDAHYLEAYEEILWQARQSQNTLVPDTVAEINTLGEWNERLRTRF